MATAATAASIPLHCNICPKKPTFSDVSHLLTHIASKGHLSHYYRIKVRATNENASRDIIEAYDRWYSEWRVEDLMSERMNVKDRKRTRAKASASIRSTPAPTGPPSKSRREPPLHGLKDDGHYDSRIDHPIKLEHGGSHRPHLYSDGGNLLRPFPHQTRIWTDSRSNSVVSNLGSRGQDFESYSETSEGSDRLKRFLSDVDCEPSHHDVPDSAKLKGVYWPGMDIFDSATPEMRRKRNQKKDVSVVEQLEVNSTEVEATELVFTPYGSFKKQRRISGLPDEDSSPIALDSSPRAPRFSRQPLSEMDVNRTRRSYHNTRQALRDASFLGGDNGYGGMRYPNSNFDRRRKRVFDVYRDDDISFANPLPMSYLTADFHAPATHTTFDANSFAPNPLEFKTFDDHFQFDERDFLDFQPDAYHYQNGLHFPSTSFFPQFQTPSAQDFSGLLTNPLCLGSFHPDDDQCTVTAPPSDPEIDS